MTVPEQLGSSSRRAGLIDAIRNERVAVMEHLRGSFRSEHEFAEQAQELASLVLLAGSARGGTSVVASALAAAENAVSLPGEHRYIFSLLEQNYPDHGGMTECADRLLTPHELVLARDLFVFDLFGEERGLGDRSAREVFAWMWALRFRLQWPEVEIELDDVVAAAFDSWAHYESPSVEHAASNTLLSLKRISAVAQQELGLEFYDLPRAVRSRLRLHEGVQECPAESLILEVTPYVVFRPRARARLSAGSSLVIKASSDAHRMATVLGLFEGWRKVVIHLARDPRASINGLLDGWYGNGFWQHRITADCGPAREIGADSRGATWWKFDLVDDWREITSLQEVAIQQWVEAHAKILAAIDSARSLGTAPIYTMQQRFEDFEAGGVARDRFVRRSCDFAGLRPSSRQMELVRQPPVVNGTKRPRPNRWRGDRPHLATACDRPDVTAMSRNLGYSLVR